MTRDESVRREGGRGNEKGTVEGTVREAKNSIWERREWNVNGIGITLFWKG